MTASKSTSPAPSPAQRSWMEMGYGLFIHFGPNTFQGTARGDGSFPAGKFTPGELDCDQWAGIAAEAGMKYAVFTAKHHDGFCLWPSAYTDYCVKNAGVKTDVVGAFVEACRRAGIRPGLYYSLWDRNCPFYDDDARYAQYMRNQVSELLTNYGPIVEMWFDGGWHKEHPAGQWWWEDSYMESVPAEVLRGGRWGWRELYDTIHARQADCLVINNSACDRPGLPRYHPIDLRTAEQYDFIYNDHLYEPVTENIFADHTGKPVFLPLEYCTSLNPVWFHIRDKQWSHPSVATICDWHRRARATGANLLLNVAPDARGLIPDYHRPYLREAAKRLGLG